MKERILFVTRGGENTGEGFPYALELARALNCGITVLVIYQKQVLMRLEDLMSAAAFAQGGDFHTADNLLSEPEKELSKDTERKISEMAAGAGHMPLGFAHKTLITDIRAAITDYLQERPAIEMVLLSPNLSRGKKLFDMKRLLRNIPKPIVNITTPEKAGA
jgi:hypothetical protein